MIKIYLSQKSQDIRDDTRIPKERRLIIPREHRVNKSARSEG